MFGISPGLYYLCAVFLKYGIIMSIREQEELKQSYYSEAMRYMDKAKEYLKNAKKEDEFYQDKKYVKTACGTAYNVK